MNKAAQRLGAVGPFCISRAEGTGSRRPLCSWLPFVWVIWGAFFPTRAQAAPRGMWPGRGKVKQVGSEVGGGRSREVGRRQVGG